MIGHDGTARLELASPAGQELADEPAGSRIALSHGQRSLWFLHHLAPVEGAYNIAAAARVLSPVDAGALRRAFQALVDRHAALRTTFPEDAGEPCQRIAGRLGFVLAREDATGWSEERLRSRLAEEAWRPFDLEQGPLLRATLFTGAFGGAGGAGGPVLLFVIHHIIADFWSLAILMRELPMLYREAAGAGPALLPPPGLSYAEHVRLEQEALRDGRGEAALAWWRESLAGLPILELPTDRPRPAVQTYRGDSLRLRLPGDLAAALRARSRAQHGTLFMTLLAAFQALLGRHSGQEDLAVGSARAGRSQSQLAGTVGYFVNQVVLRADLAGDPSFAELLERTRARVLAAFAHGDYPLPLLAEHLQPERDASRTPLFQVSFVLQKETRGVEGLTAFALGEEGVEVGPEDFRLKTLAVPRQPSPFDLVLHCVDRQGGLSLALQYNRDLLDATTAARLLEHFVRLLAGAAADPGQLLSELPMLSAAEREQLLVEWSGEATSYPREGTIHALFAEQAALRPDAVAVAGDGESLTYGELACRAGAWALRLAASGVGPEMRVGVCLDRSPARVVATLAVLAAGGVYVPLDPSYPRERLAFLVRDSAASVLVTEERWLAVLPQTGAAVLCLDTEPPPQIDRPAAAPDIPASALAYVMYTSGSTGEPKGVAVPHRAVVRLVRETGYARFGPDEVFLQLAPHAFDAATLELWGALLNGGRVVMPPQGVLSPAELGELLQRHGVTTLWLTAGLFHQMVDENLPGLSGVRQLLAGGDVLSVAHVRRVLAELPGTRLINGYGPTENTTFTCCHPVTGAGLEPSVPLGRPIANTRVYVLGRNFEPMPAGVAGELLAGGDGLARGYLGRPERTAEHFVPDPVGGERGGRLYRTGDLVRWRPSGELEFLGRIDTQVKVRGFRVEPGEIETALLAHPWVRDAVVLAPREVTGGRRLVAYLAGPEGEVPRESELRDFLRERLPDFMLPAAYAFLPALPLTVNGKVDRKALAELRPERLSGSAGPEPRTPAEELVAGIFAEVLRVERVGVADDFFALGGHSLLATQVASRVRSVFAVELPLRALFEAPTVEGLAGWLERSARDVGPAIVPVSRDEPPALSFAQQRLWFLDQLEPGSPIYNIPAAVELSGRLDRAALAAALGEVVRRHEALRTVFAAMEGEPVQVVGEPAGLAVPLVDLQHLPAPESAIEAGRLAFAEARRPFDLGRGPLLRTALLKLGAERHTMLVTMHHIVSDGWSLGVMVRELGALYAAFVAGRPSPLPELAIQYADFAVWQRRSLAGEALDAELAWWRDQLAGMPPTLELPTDHPRPAERSTRGAVHDFAMEGEGLAAFSRRQGVTPFMLLLAGFAGLLQRFTGGEDLAVGTPIAGRTRVETEPLIGFFVNTLVLRLGLSGAPGFLDLLGRVRETALAAYAHQDVPFERLVEELAPERDRSRPPLVQVLFALQNTPFEPLALPGLELTVAPQETGTAKLELSCVLTAAERGLAGTLEYNRDLFDRTTAVRLAEVLARFLEAAVDAPETRVSDLPVLSPAERAALLFEWNDTAAASSSPLVHELFAEQARRQPDALAVAAPGERLNYGELAARAGRLARLLGRLGVGAEVRVALCAGATVHRVVGSLAVLLAGGAYVLLDPEAPPERLAYLVADSGAAAVLTERSLTGRFGSCAVPLVELESGEVEESAGAWPVPAVPAVGPQSLAYVVYTSGSTGLPKGVAVSHAGLLNLVSWHRAVYGLSPADRATLIANPAFDAAVWELWPCLAAGASLHISEDEIRFAPQAIVHFWQSAGITWSFLPTPLAEEVIAEGAASLTGLSLKGLLCGGDRLHRGPGPDVPFALVNHYGPSEVSVVSTFAAVPPDTVGAPPIGRPIQRVRAFVADARGALVPRGAAGELWIGGASLARGYLGRPALTAERFVPDPWSGEPGERLYRTGDLVRHRPGGSLDFLGRIDRQIKLRGFRIEPGEIEAALRGHPAVSEAAVTVHAQRLVAYVVGAGERAPSGGELRDFLRERLPGPLVPASYVALAALPLAPNGKLDRKALPGPGPADAADAFIPPRTPVEARVAGIFAEVLGVARVGVEDDFFALGGHSLLAAQVAARVRSAFGVELPVRSVFETPTVEGLAAWVERSTGEAGPAPIPVVRVSREQPLPLSFAQQRLWFLERIEPGAPFFHLPAALDCHGLLDPAALARSLGEILRRHEVLRTRFALTGRRPVQIPLAPAELAAASLLPCVDLSALSMLPVLEAEVARLTAAEAGRPFDLERGPLLHAVLVRRGPESHRLLLTVHHIAADASSVGLLIRELGQLYAAFTESLPSPLPDLAIQYGDFAVWQRERLRGELLDGHLRSWTERLARLPTLELPTDRPRPPVQSYRGARRPVHLDAGTTGGLRRLGGPAGVTLFMAVLAVFQAVLARHSGQEDVVVGTAVSERPDPALEGVIGLFLNTLVLRSDLSGDPAFREILERVQGVVLDALAHAELPFERLVEAMQPERDLSRSPLFQVFFALRNEPLPALDLPGLRLRPADTSARAAQLDLSLHLEESGGGLDGWIDYNPDLFDGATMERLALHCGVLLAGAVAAPDGRLSALPLLSEPEKAQLLVQWNDTRTAASGAAACIHELFRAQVERTPGAVAAVDVEASVTYRELADRASRLAERLVRLGVRPGDRVGVCVERSLAMLVALLGVLRAGAAYVPLDPDYPQARLAAMLEDSQAAALVASAGVSLEHPRTLAPEAEEAAAPGDALPELPAEAAAYVIYTSGSTGVPKGVVVSHRNAAFFFAAMDRELRPEGAGVWLAVTSICFDISVLELLWTLTRGFKVVIHGGRPEGASVAEQIALHGVSHLQCTPSMAGMLAASPERLRSLAPLSRLLLGGEALPAFLAERLRGAVRGEVRNLYGPTETTVWSLGERVEGGEERPLIGRPLANTEVYLLDASLRPVPLGAPGEVFLGGEGVAAGYWRRPGLTAERFLPDSLGSRPGGRLYRTGDLARHRPDGRLDFIGRSDHQVKVRGVRVELGEIEAALRAHPAVAQAVAAVRENARGDRRLIAYLVPAAGGAESDLAIGALRRHLAARLPEAMIPSVFVPLAALPLTPNGKIDRRALPAPEAGRPRLDSDYAAPRTPGEKTLAAVWQEVLGRERIGIHDNFFELGGSSLLLVEIESRLREVLGREIPIVQIFRNPTIHSLAQALEAGERAPSEPVERLRPPAGEALGEGSALERQRQFLAEMKRQRAQQRRPGR
ncbi:MAG TPA: amino acid adenylation domain-containing protein [Thermoanaerobaculia bacterium]|nr:amino acid adenylation domain-containing protein [Thermoanaerobaculia bacterium]